MKHAGGDSYLLLRYVRLYLPDFWDGVQLQALRQVFLQNYWIDGQGNPRWRESNDGLPHRRRPRLRLSPAEMP